MKILGDARPMQEVIRFAWWRILWFEVALSSQPVAQDRLDETKRGGWDVDHLPST